MKKPWPEDAPQNFAWRCPDCGSQATLGGNAGFHRDKEKHGEPVLVKLDENENPLKPEWIKVQIVLKSGKEIVFECKEMTWKTDGELNITSYIIKQFKNLILSYIQPSEIAAIVTLGESK